MTRLLFSLTLLLFAYAAKGQYAIRNVSVIPMTNTSIQQRILHGQTVVVENGIITRVGPTREVRIPGVLTIIDGHGKFLIPGLIDMHAHFFSDVGDERHMWEHELKLMLANGVTTARLMTGHPAYLDLKRKINAGELRGPNLFVASPQLVGKWYWSADFKNFEITDSPEKGMAAVRRFKDEGYDEIKISLMVTAPVYDAIVTTAKDVGMKVTGHVGPLVGLPRALKAGQQIEHMDQFIEMLLPDTSYNHGQSVSDFNVYSKQAWETVPHLDESKIPALVSMVKEAGISVTPTNNFMITSFGELPTDEEIRNMPDYEFIPPVLKEEKWKHRKSYMSKMAPEKDRQRYVYLRQKMAYELYNAGVPLMAGSDSPEYFIVAGLSLHQELRSLAAAGLSAYACLETATVNPAKYLGVFDRMGTIQKGKEARLLLLDKNPLSDITNTSAINSVFTMEKWYDAKALKQMLDDAKSLGR